MGRGITNSEKQFRAELFAHGLKKCSRCDPPRIKPVSEFIRRKRSSDGLDTYCKQCHQAYQRIYNKEHRNERQEYNRVYYQRHRDERQEYNRVYREGHQDVIRKYQRTNYEEHRDEIQQYTQAYRQTEQGKHVRRAAKHRRRIRKRRLQSDLTLGQWKYTLEYFDHRCAYCGTQPEYPEQLVQEHFIPVVLAGDYSANNIIPACVRCNSAKYIQLAADWLPRVDYVLDDALERINQYIAQISNTAVHGGWHV